jgi:glycosyltransferase involved in cell wall biosynthesis
MDVKCLSYEKIQNRTLGGAELFFLLLEEYLQKKYKVTSWPNKPRGEYDLCIHSNEFSNQINAKKHLLWCGSWGCHGYEKADATIVLTDFMRKKLGWDNARVIPAPYNREILNFKGLSRVKGRIVCTSNPNRHFLDSISLSSDLNNLGIDHTIEICGGNKLYSDGFPEGHNFNSHPNINYHGPLSRGDMFGLLSTAHVWAYPAFQQNAETQSVAPIEAMALGIPTVLPEKEPFIEISNDIDPKPFLCANREDFSATVARLLDREIQTIDYDVSRYRDEVSMAYVLQIVSDLIG